MKTADKRTAEFYGGSRSNARVIALFFSILILTNFKALCFDGALFKPLTANVFEPRVGAIHQGGEEKLRLDIGTSIDFARFNVTEHFKAAVGTDFFTYTRLRSEGKFKFPVETSDYFFGVNSSFIYDLAEYRLSCRVRLAHISSHLVDGLSDEGIFEKAPFTYSREFFDLILAAEKDGLRVYLGGSFIFSTIPDNVDKIVPQFGADYEIKLYKYIDFSVGCDYKFYGSESVGQGALQAGLKLKTSERVAVFLGCYYYDGINVHGMFYDELDSYFGCGFQLCFY